MAAPDPKEVMKLAGKIVTARQQLAELEAQWNGMFGEKTKSSTRQTPHRKVKPGRKADEFSFTTQVLEHLNSRSGHDFSIEELMEHFDKTRQQIERTLAKLYSTERISRRGRGKYGAKQTSLALEQGELAPAA